LTNLSWQVNGEPFFPVSCGLHYARLPAYEWAEALGKLRAGGCTMVQTYVFWIHHEEVQGQWRWDGRRNLTRFLQLAQAADLQVLLRVGPWSHGEARGGGFPDWLEELAAAGKVRLRSTDPAFLNLTQAFFEQQQSQIQGMWWHEGGPVWHVQVSNEFSGDPDYLIAVKNLALQVGMCPAYFSKTGWPSTSSPMPPGSLVPLLGGYVADFWSPSSAPAAPSGQYAFVPTATGSEYPVIGVEFGGGMATAYHRRPVVVPDDVSSDMVFRIGSSVAGMGYYVYHGGTNPEGELSYLEETQASGGANDLPVRSYDYAAPLSEFGEARSHYHKMRLLHLLQARWGDVLAPAPVTMPAFLPLSPSDHSTVRWAVRGGAATGAILPVCNYQRLVTLDDHPAVQFRVNFPTRSVLSPSSANLTLPAGACYALPLMVDVGRGVIVVSATSQIVTSLDNGTDTVVVLVDTAADQLPAGHRAREVIIANSSISKIVSSVVAPVVLGGDIVFRGLPAASRTPVVSVTPAVGSGTVHLVLLSREDAQGLYQLSLAGQERIVIASAVSSAFVNVTAPDTLHLLTSSRTPTISVWPALGSAQLEPSSPALPFKPDGPIFVTTPSLAPMPAPPASLTVQATPTRQAGPARDIPTGRSHRAEEPTDQDFTQAALWTLALPTGLQSSQRRVMMRVNYTGDVARLYLNGTLLTDNQYTGRLFSIGLDRYASASMFKPGVNLTLAVLPLREDSPVYMPVRPVFPPGPNATVLSLNSITLDWQSSLTAQLTR
jgi:hypothetical protein